MRQEQAFLMRTTSSLRAVPLLGLVLSLAVAQTTAALSVEAALARGIHDEDWHTNTHQPGVCAMRGVCGKRRDGDPLNCPANVPAEGPSSELAFALAKTCPSFWAAQGADTGKYCCTADQVANIASSTQRVVPFVVGCPACLHNFVHFWCELSCSPDQSTWTEVVAVQPAPSNNATVVSELNYWVSADYGDRFFNSCKDVKFGAANVPAMTFIGGGAKSFQEWGDFLGLVKDKRFPPIGSPFQINFLPSNSSLAPGVTPLSDPGGAGVVACGDPAFRCSCSDCPAGPDCDSGGDEDDDTGDGDTSAADVWPHCHVGAITCWEFSLIWVWAASVTGVVLGFTGPRRVLRGLARVPPPRARAWLLTHVTPPEEPGGVRQPLLQPDGSYGEGKTGGNAVAWAYEAAQVPEPNPLQDLRTHYPWQEHVLQQAYYKLGKVCALYPWRVIGLGVVLIGACCLGLLRFRVETAPEKLWVGPSSTAAREAAEFERSFGPFYRVTQVMVTTTPDSDSPYTSGSPGGLPGIPTPAHLDLMWDMWEVINTISAEVTDEDGPEDPAGPPTRSAHPPTGRTPAVHTHTPRRVTLEDVCYKPFGDVCAVQSVLQYWRLDRALYNQEMAKPVSAAGRMTLEYCTGHWSTACLSAYGAPMEPRLVLGGFPTRKALFRNYTADSTSFVLTLPLSSRTATRQAALAWEAAFLQVASEQLEPLVRAHNLSLSYSAQRSVQDELSRESGSDAVTVAASYAAMLVYIAAALGSLPVSCRQALQVLVLSRVGLGLGGVLIVAGSVAGALGLVSATGLWSTLIIMEVIPFLALAVGVDNMFMLVYSLQRQDVHVPLVERVAGAVAAAGPSITLAAGCEVLAFSLGALSPMPAVRNFSICAAVALALDFLLQITVFVSLLTLDTRRMEQHRADLAPCVVIRPVAAPLHAPRAYGGIAQDDTGMGGLDAGEGLADGGAGFGLLAGSGGNDGGGSTAVPTVQGLYRRSALPEPWLQTLLHKYMHRVHIPLLQSRVVQAGVLFAFITGLILSLVAMPRLSVGLDQAVALPADSYLQRYFADLESQLRVGPPLYLVVRDLNTSAASPHVAAVCGVSGCDPHSLVNTVAAAARQPRTSHIASGVASWVDDFMAWLNPGLTQCCREHTGRTPPSPSPPPPPFPPPSPSPSPPTSPDTPPGPGTPAEPPQPPLNPPSPEPSSPLSPEPSLPTEATSNTHTGSTAAGQGKADASSSAAQAVLADEGSGFCPPPDQPPCSDGPGRCLDCKTCVTNSWPGGRPDTPAFQRYLPWFLTARPSAACAKGGAGAYNDLIAREGGPDAPGPEPAPVQGLADQGIVAASAFRTFYTPLNEQQDFIAALRAVRGLVARLQDTLGLPVYPYSVFHVFFEQYLYAWRDAALLLGTPLLGVGVTAALVTGSLWGAALLLTVLASLLVHMMGAMWLAGIQLNAVSLVNLAMSLGIAVEFCAHVSHAFGVAPGTRPQRVALALEKSGASVLSGITFTKLVGVAVLAGARTRIFELYYFRLYLALVVLGGLHGLVLLPVLLSLIGPPSWSTSSRA